MKKPLLFLLLALSIPAVAQNKQVMAIHPQQKKFGLLERTVVDTTSIRFYYAFNALDIKDIDSYLDLGMLQIGKRMSKYSSSFLAHSDSLVIDWWKAHHKPDASPKKIELRGRMDGYWSEYQYSDIFIDSKGLTEWAIMPRFFEKDCARYTEPYPLMKWTIQKESATICGYQCQKATCHYRGRDFEAWFAPSIPIKKGPWKFGGLPGLILKVYDKDHLYTFECVRVEKGRYPMVQYPEKYFPVQTRDKIYKTQVKINESYGEIFAFSTNRKDFYEYDPLELE